MSAIKITIANRSGQEPDLLKIEKALEQISDDYVVCKVEQEERDIFDIIMEEMDDSPVLSAPIELIHQNASPKLSSRRILPRAKLAIID